MSYLFEASAEIYRSSEGFVFLPRLGFGSGAFSSATEASSKGITFVYQYQINENVILSEAEGSVAEQAPSHGVLVR
jgi:hypothetical protein